MSTTSSLFPYKCFMKLLCHFAEVTDSNFSSILSDLSDEFIAFRHFHLYPKYSKEAINGKQNGVHIWRRGQNERGKS